MNLTKLLKPKSVAVIGASEKEGFGGDVCRNTLSYVEDMSRVYFVHPKRESVFGVPCYKSISDIPDTIDMMVICTSQNSHSASERRSSQGCWRSRCFCQRIWRDRNR